jgi:hypothetical protein
MTRATIVIICICLVSCAGGMRLSDSERAKLDPPLQRLLTGEQIVESDYDFGTRPDGTKEYAVIVRSKSVEELKSAGIRVSSIFGDVITTRVTIEELRKLVGLTSVRSVEVGSKNVLH